MVNYTDETTGLNVTLHRDGTWEITAGPAAPNLLPTTVMTGRATEDTPAETQIEAFLSSYKDPNAATEKTEETVAAPEAPASTEQTEEEKTEAAKPKQGKLPEDFPGYAALDEAGIHTYAQLRKVKDLLEVPGIGPATAEKIKEEDY